ncbi:hypothetical protein Lesp02_53130 [Lentzea sp. NBRC 105346]|uniref:hypothetical protein n=1 Tax=Lentzea sp. NBRC 105346 TaxID=3032205 RepID=UPI0024A2C9A6|nr:hypothetical protein [Lentzea sp. NBRC 105346]GLZ33125.1 hypothetical protein Lesp02_53130 [Lentzea sp. NBRC 105346]
MYGVDLANVIVLGVFGLLILVALWPNERNGRRLLLKWKVTDPTPDEVAEAVRYLKRRRLLYPWLYLAAGLLTGKSQGNMDAIVITVFVGTLLAELLALRPPRDRQRAASLTPRGLADIASPIVLLTYVVGVIVAAVLVVLWRGAFELGMLLGSVVVVAVIVWAAVNRPASGDARVDNALRTRSIHVSAGLGITVALGMAGGFAALAGILLWVAMANTPPREDLPRLVA